MVKSRAVTRRRPKTKRRQHRRRIYRIKSAIASSGVAYIEVQDTTTSPMSDLPKGKLVGEIRHHSIVEVRRRTHAMKERLNIQAELWYGGYA